jgi:hypothetical protein
MMLPNAADAVVPRRKIVDYLLSATHVAGKGKAGFFRAFGFCVADWHPLAKALHEHAQRNEVRRVEPSPFGTRFIIEGIIDTPVGKSPRIRSVWYIDND